MRGNRHYVHLAIMTALSFISMYILMYAMVNRFANVYSNLNQFYMAGLMTAPIVVIELALMRSVYDNKNANIVIIAVSVVALGAFFVGIRQQAAIGALLLIAISVDRLLALRVEASLRRRSARRAS